mmetsp:Transcript_22032/g.37466  ORF Transcript_22032/g.37466 Transcript_22032/m.37466 type:complete len:83 (-) Transcript_22032:878-1126(-)
MGTMGATGDDVVGNGVGTVMTTGATETGATTTGCVIGDCVVGVVVVAVGAQPQGRTTAIRHVTSRAWPGPGMVMVLLTKVTR